MMFGKQLTFELNPVEPNSLGYFVPHSGVSDAYQTLVELLDPSAERTDFNFFYIVGPAGSGKSHLINGLIHELKAAGYSPESVASFDPVDENGEPGDEMVARFIAQYEDKRSRGGVVFCASRKMPLEASSNPHLNSRLLAGNILELNYPREEELAPLIDSLLERNNLSLSEKSISFLLKRLPKDPLSLETILARISELSLSEGKPARFGVVRNVVQGVVQEATARVTVRDEEDVVVASDESKAKS